MIRTHELIRKDDLFSVYLDSDRISKVSLGRNENKSLRDPKMCKVLVYWNIPTYNLLGKLLKHSEDERYSDAERLFFKRCYSAKRDNFIKASTLLKIREILHEKPHFGMGREIDIFLESIYN